MRMMTMKFLTLALFVGVALFTPPALAEKGGKGKNAQHSAKHADKPGHHAEDLDNGNSGRSKADHKNSKKHGSDEDDLIGFNNREVDAITGALKRLYGKNDERFEVVRPSHKNCPPGLAKKNNGCMPPGLAKKYNVGERLPEDVVSGTLSKVLSDVLGLPPKGKEYVQVDNDVLLIEQGTKIVLDAIGLGSRR